MTESPQYTVISKHSGIEIRQYAAFIQAEVTVEAESHRVAIENGFNLLAGYIFGNNVSRQKLEMTTPVQASQSERIAMTTPVTVSGASSFTVAFIMPSAYTLETLPVPVNGRIRFRQIPARSVAAVRFTGYFQPETIRQNQLKLALWLKEQGIEPAGDFIIAGYNPPWVPGFLARNEVLVPIQPRLSGGV